MFTGVYIIQSVLRLTQLHKITMHASDFPAQPDGVKQLSHNNIDVSSFHSSCRHTPSTTTNVPPAPRKFIRKQDGTARNFSASPDHFAEKLEFIIASKQAVGREIVSYESAKWEHPLKPSASLRECSRAG